MTPNLNIVVGIVVGIVAALAVATAVAAVMAVAMVMPGSDRRRTPERRTANQTPRRSPAPSC